MIKDRLLKEMPLQFVSMFRDALMGIAALSILLMHFVSYKIINIKTILPLNALISRFGSAGVDIFCLLSGMGIYFSLKKEYKYAEYIEKRFFRIMIPYWLISIPAYYIVGVKGVWEWFLRLTALLYWFDDNDGSWFISFILLSYIVAPILEIIIIKQKSIKKDLLLFFSIYLVALVILEWHFNFILYKYQYAIYRIPLIPMGMYLGYKIDEKEKIKVYTPVLCGIIAISKPIIARSLPLGLTDSLFLTYIQQICLAVLYIYIEVIILKYSKQLNMFFSFLGKMSLEIYLAHIFLIQVIMNTDIKLEGNTFLFAAFLVTTLFISIVVRRLSRCAFRVKDEKK